MIRLSNGHAFEYMTASGALGFDGRGWWWEKPLVTLGFMRPDLFTVVLRTLTWKPRPYGVSNLSWMRPWTWLPWNAQSCVQFIPGGVVNKVGLWNPGFKAWYYDTAPRLTYDRPLVASIYGAEDELKVMVRALEKYPFKAVEINVSCPNHRSQTEEMIEIVRCVKAVGSVTNLPLILKLSVAQDYIPIARLLKDVVQAISLNSVPFHIAFPDIPPQRSPVWKVGKERGGGGISGKPAQAFNWAAVAELSTTGDVPVIGPSVMEYEDVARLRQLGAAAVSFGAIHCKTPWKPTDIIQRDMRERGI